MENASKALIMAGGILIALMILASFVYLFNEMTENANLQDKQQKAEQIAEFNKTYEAYQRNLMRGADVISVCNRANDYNTKNQDTIQKDDEIRIWVTFIEKEAVDEYERIAWTEFKKNTKYDMTSYFINLENTDKEKFRTFKSKYFECKDITYSNITGKVTSLSFKEVDGDKLLKID